MKIKIRRVGNSLGILLPKEVLLGWGLSEGDSLELGLNGIRPTQRTPRRKHELGELSRSMGLAVIRQFTAREIRAQMRISLRERRQQYNWDANCAEWEILARSKDDGALFAAMLGRDERAINQRQYMPYIDLLSAAQQRAFREGAGG